MDKGINTAQEKEGRAEYADPLQQIAHQQIAHHRILPTYLGLTSRKVGFSAISPLEVIRAGIQHFSRMIMCSIMRNAAKPSFLVSNEERMALLFADGWSRHATMPRIWLSPNGAWYRSLTLAWAAFEESSSLH